MTLAGHSARTAALALSLVLFPARDSWGLARSAQCVACRPGRSTHFELRQRRTNRPIDGKKRTLEMRPGAMTHLVWRPNGPLRYRLPTQASLKGKGLRRREGPGVGRPCQGGRPGSGTS